MLGQEYQQNNASLREVGHGLSALRDAKALLEMLDQMNDKYRKQLGDRSLAQARHALVKRKEQCQRELGEKNVWPELRRQLQQVSEQVDSWSLPDQQDFALLTKGVERVFRDGRKAFARAYDDPRPERFHDWRKRAKDHWYHLRLLEKSWPEVMEGYADGVKQLEQKLGDDHNLVVLRDTVVRHPEEFGSEEDREALLTLIGVYQHELRTEARTLGERIYGEKPKRLVRRLERYWRAWQEEKRSSGPDDNVPTVPAVPI
jgi:CHAD domain-containing protein